MFTAAVYIITVIQTQPKCLLINEMDNDYTHIHRYIYIYTHTHTHTHTHSGILLSHKKDEILSFVTTWVNLQCII